ncbi:Rve-domain-containing hypothetical protein [Phytophthora megakarya]|uniref:Integrase catalytic domain-containing protein n=1 Tax=Phytophthora megakarya TaxID=4795 RepID=A0A225VH24_9STRA|nr:Rve-domain-containing hypothetical protein [Phytophthora megakarya]
MQTTPTAGCKYVVTFIEDVLSKLKIYKAATKNTLKQLRSDNGGEYIDQQCKRCVNHHDIKYEKTVPHTPQEKGLAERLSRTVNTAAWVINLVPVKTPYEIINGTNQAPAQELEGIQRAHVRAHIAAEKHRKPDPKSFMCSSIAYDDDVDIM